MSFASKSANQRALQLESLETRAMMAGNVSVSVVNSGAGDVDLLIEGDNAANAIEVYSPVRGVVHVVGQSRDGSATRINGVVGRVVAFTNAQYTDDIRIKMNGGSDWVWFHGNSSFLLDCRDDLRVSTGSGNDQVFLNYTRAPGDISIDLGSGRDYLSAYALIAGDDVLITNSDTSRTRQVTEINLDNVFAADDLNIDLSYSLDRVNIRSCSARDLLVDLNSGDDKLNVKRTTAASANLDGGSGTDDLNLFLNSRYTFTNTAFKSPTRLELNY